MSPERGEPPSGICTDFPAKVLQSGESVSGPAAEAGPSGAALGRGVGEGKCFSTPRVSLPASKPESPYINIDLSSCRSHPLLAITPEAQLSGRRLQPLTFPRSHSTCSRPLARWAPGAEMNHNHSVALQPPCPEALAWLNKRGCPD